MLSPLIKYLRAKIAATQFVDKVYGMGEVRELDGEKFPAVYNNGELIHIDFDTYEEVCFFILDGKVSREGSESPYIANVNNIKDVYNLKCILYIQGDEDINCQSDSQRIAYAVSKAITGIHPTFSTETQLDLAFGEVKEIDLSGDSVWGDIFSGDSKLKDDDILISISFDFTLSGREECFVSDDCENLEFIFNLDGITFCARVNQCITTTDGGQFGFTTTDATEYTFNGTANAYNANAVDLRGATLNWINLDGLLWVPTSDYTFNSTTGGITFVKDCASGVYGFINYTT